MKKFFSILLSAALIVSLLTPMGVAWAEEADDVVSSSEVKDGEVKDDEVKDDEVKDDEVKDNEVKDDEVKDDEVKDDEVKDDEVKDGEVKDDEVKDGEVKDDEVKDDEVKDDEVKDDEVKDDEVKDGEAKDDEVKDVEVKDGEVEDGDVKDDPKENVDKNAGTPELLFIDPSECDCTGATYTVMEPDYSTNSYEKVDDTTHRVTYNTQKVTRCLSCGTELSREDGEPYTYTQNHYYNTDGDCVCGAHTDVGTGGEGEDPETCTHTNKVDWLYSDQDSFQADSLGTGFHRIKGRERHQVVCLDCGKILSETDWVEVTRTEPHFIAGGVCDACGYKNECTHSEDSLAHRTVLLETTLVVSVKKTGHVMQRDSMIETYCTKCGDILWTEFGNVVQQEENHVFADGKCIFCGYTTTCSHSRTKAVSGVMTTDEPTYTKLDEKTHQVNVYEGTWYTCLDCAESWFKAASEQVKTRVEAHNFSGGKCYCGAVNPCSHPGKTEREAKESSGALVSQTDSEHTIRYTQYVEIRCADCGEILATEIRNNQVEKTSAHTYVDGKCSECGYVKPAPTPDPEPTEPATTPAATRPTEPEATEPVFTEVASDEPVHGVKVSDNLTMTQTVTKVIEDIETSETAKIQIRNVDQILNQEEVKQMEAIPVKEQVFAFLTVMGFGDTIEKALDEADEQMSQKTLSLIESIQTRMDNMTQQERKEFNKVLEELFPITKVVIDGVEYEWFQFEIQVEDGDTVRIERYGFRLEDGEWILSRLETADVEK